MPPATPQSTAATTAAAASTANHRPGNSNSNLNPNKIDLKNPNNFNRATNSRISSVDTDMPDPNSSTGNTAARPSSSNALTPIKIDGWEEDAVLSQSKHLHRVEVYKRRNRRSKQLQRIYRDCYWSLMEEVKLKHREYCWKFGMSAFQEDEDKNNKDGTLGTGENNGNAVASNTCGVHGCKSKAMALTRFCHMHILSDSKQKLYKACSFAIKSSPTGPILCGKPILRSAVPSYCSLHSQKAEKHVARALKKAGLNGSNTSKIVPKFHVIVAECVSQIQNRRRAAQKATLEMAEVKEESSC
uniref:KAT8 regulatory NSL complex subunit 2 n=1 Tax=Solanum chacoense TaxID=4108 RepID=A0A0V0HNT5_SOLCH